MIYKVKWFKNKTHMIICISIFLIFIALFIIVGTRDYKKNDMTDSQKFASEHKETNKDNIFVYINGSDAYTYIGKDDVIILFGVKDSSWVSLYANILDEVAKSIGIKQIYYYDITEDRKNSNATYESIVEYLGNNITYLDDLTANIYGPTLFIKKDGIISFYDDETAFIKGKITASEYWNEYQVNLKKATLKVALEDFIK